MPTDQRENQGLTEAPAPPMRATYIRVVIVEMIVLLTLWVLSRAFSG